MEGSFIDKILIQTNNTDSGYKVIHFTRTPFSYFAVSALKSNTSFQKSLHIACEAPLIKSGHECLTGHWACVDGTCIVNHHVCDGMIDCPDGSDERECNHVCVFKNKTNLLATDCFGVCYRENCTCDDLYFHCKLGRCIPWSKVCDGTPDCAREEDEELCYFIAESSNGSLVKITQNSGNLEMEIDMDIAVSRRLTNCSDGQEIREIFI